MGEVAHVEQLTVDQVLHRADTLEKSGDTEKALKLFQAVLQALPQNEKARQAVARLSAPRSASAPQQQDIDELVNLYNQGRFQVVAEKAERLAHQYPSVFGVWNILGAAAAQDGQFPLAERAFRKASELNRSAPEARNNLGNALKEQGKFDEAVDAYKQALAINPNYVLAHNNIGVTLHEQHRFDDAAAAFREALRLKPDYAEALNHYGVTLQELGKFDEAAETLGQAIRIAPGYVDAHNNLGNVFKELGKVEQAVAAYESAIELKPDYAKAHNNKGIVLKKQGEFEQAIACYRQALQLAPDYPEALNNLGNALEEVFQSDDAVAEFRKALELRPGFTEAYLNLSRSTTFTAGDPLIARMVSLHGDANVEDYDRVDLCFALTKAHEDLEDYATAFSYLSEGNSLRKKLLGYDLASDERLFSSIRSVDPEVNKAALGTSGGVSSPIPIFILGMPRSGTTLVEQIVSAHYDVVGAGEIHFVEGYGRSVATGNRRATPDELQLFQDRYRKEINKLADSGYVTDKMPQNFRYVGLICNALPDARIVHVQRSPAATCWSNFRQYFAGDGLAYCHDLDDLVRYYEMYQDLMRYWNDRYGDRIYALDYDALTTNQETVTRELIDHIGLEWDEACLAPQDNRRVVKTASRQQVRKAVYSGSSEKWRRYEPYLGGAFDLFEG
jgi:tetratricopeptide (TPR) repeat protein